MAIPDTTSVRSFVDSARHISILLSQKPDFDSVAAGLGLKLSLVSAGKSARVVCPAQMVVEFNRLVGVESVTSDFGNRNLIICFPGQTEHVDQVNYNLEKGELQLVISPKPEAPNLDHTRLKYITATQNQDLIITLGVTDLRDLGPVYEQAKDHLQKTTVISISHAPHQQQFTPYRLHDHEASSLSEITAHLIDSLGLSLDQDAATNLLFGLEKATSSFKSPKVSVGTFEIAAKLMRRGARRHLDEISATDFPAGSVPEQIVPNTTSGEVGQALELAPDQLPVEQQSSGSASPSSTTNGRKSAPPDWYEPKIYKGPMLP